MKSGPQVSLRHRRIRALLLGVLGVGLPAAASELPAPILSLEDVRAGQRGYGLSVFRGVEPERFEVEVLGVLRDTSPGTSYILARLSGRGLESTGVIAGMSGSPVYIEGRLAGAVAFSWPFADEPVAGITPIESMRAMLQTPSPPPPAAAGPAVSLMDFVQPPSRGIDVLVEHLQPLRMQSRDGRSAAIDWLGTGFLGQSRGLLERGLGALSPTGVGAVALETSSFVPGGSVAGLLIDGDLRLAATGTVTDVLTDGTVLAFGHPFLGLGPIRVPMAGAEVITVLDSQYSSFKIANVGAVAGVFDLDRLPGLRGRPGLEAPMLPLTVAVEGSDERRYELRVARVPTLTPTLLAIATLGSLDATTHVAGEQGVDLEVDLKLAGRPRPLLLRQSFDGLQAGTEAALYVYAIAAYLEQNPWAVVEIESVAVRLQQHPEPRVAELLGAYASRTRLHPGDAFIVSVDAREWRGRRVRRAIPVTLPEGLPAGRYHLLVGDGASIDGARLSLERTRPQQIEQALSLLGGLHSRRELVVLGIFQDRGLNVAGEAMPQLPGSLQSIWSASTSAAATPLQIAVAQQVVVELDGPLQGLTRVSVEVRRREPLGTESEVGDEFEEAMVESEVDAEAAAGSAEAEGEPGPAPEPPVPSPVPPPPSDPESGED